MSRKTLVPALLVAGALAVAAPTVAAATVVEVPDLLRAGLEAAERGGEARPPQVGPAGLPAAQPPAGPPAVVLLRSWDARRAQAWARGDPRALRALYTPGSVAGRRDRAMLRAWRSRGLVVRGLQTQLIAVRTLHRTASTWRLRVVDRLAGGIAVGAGTWRRLPGDRATARVVVLRRSGGRWQVASVGPGSDRRHGGGRRSR